MSIVSVVLGVTQIIIQLAVVYLVYKIYTYNRVHKAWLAVAIAVILMTLRRVTALSIDMGALPQLSGYTSFIDRIVLPFCISVLLFIGFWVMLKNFKEFEVVEKQVQEKVKRVKRR